MILGKVLEVLFPAPTTPATHTDGIAVLNEERGMSLRLVISALTWVLGRGLDCCFCMVCVLISTSSLFCDECKQRDVFAGHDQNRNGCCCYCSKTCFCAGLF